MFGIIRLHGFEIHFAPSLICNYTTKKMNSVMKYECGNLRLYNNRRSQFHFLTSLDAVFDRSWDSSTGSSPYVDERKYE